MRAYVTNHKKKNTFNLTSHNFGISTLLKHELTIKLFVKSSKEGQNCGLNPSLKKPSIKSSLARCVLEPILKVRCNYETSSFHISNYERILGSKIRYAHGTHCPKSHIGLCKASLGPPILEGQAKKTVFNSPTTLFVYGN